MARRLALASLTAVLALGVGGCGDGGVSSGATLRVYVAAPLCAGAQHELAAQGGRAGDLKVKAVCLPGAERRSRLDLAAIGAGARRATEDSTAIAYLEPPVPANRFSQTIVEESGIAWIKASSGASAMDRILSAIAEADSGSVRDKVREALE